LLQLVQEHAGTFPALSRNHNVICATADMRSGCRCVDMAWRRTRYRGHSVRSRTARLIGVTYSSFLTLASCGLVAPDFNANWRIGEPSDENVLITYKPYLLLFKRFGTPHPMTLSAWPLTAVGKELARLIEVQHNWDYVKRFVADQEALGWRLNTVLTPVGFPPPSDLPTQTRKTAGSP